MGQIIDIHSESTPIGPMVERRLGTDRRAPFERRKGYGSPVLTHGGGKERRRNRERRFTPQRRFGWYRVGRWSSDCVFWLA